MPKGGGPGLWAAGPGGTEAAEAPRGPGRPTLALAPRGGSDGRDAQAQTADWRTEANRGPGRGRRWGNPAAAPRERTGGAAGRGPRGRRREGCEGLPPRQPARRPPAPQSSSPHLGIRGENRATAGRLVGFQPPSLTWRPTSCHRACSGLPPLGWRRHLRPSRPASLCAPPPAGRLAAGGPRPRSIERGRLERKRRGRTTIEYESRHNLDGRSSSSVHSQTSGVLTGTETEVRKRGKRWGHPHAQFVVFTSARPGRVVEGCCTWGSLCGVGRRCKHPGWHRDRLQRVRMWVPVAGLPPRLTLSALTGACRLCILGSGAARRKDVLARDRRGLSDFHPQLLPSLSFGDSPSWVTKCRLEPRRYITSPRLAETLVQVLRGGREKTCQLFLECNPGEFVVDCIFWMFITSANFSWPPMVF